MQVREFFTDEQVELEIDRLINSDAVKLARKEQYLKNKRRQQMYMLRTMEKRGLQLMDCGITLENIEKEMFREENEAWTV